MARGIVEKKVYKTGLDPGYKTDVICIEEPLEIILQFGHAAQLIKKSIAIVMRTPGEEEELILGFLFNEGILDHPTDQIASIDLKFSYNDAELSQQTAIVTLKPGILPKLEHADRIGMRNSSCGICGRSSIENMLDQCNFILKKSSPQIALNLIYTLPSKLSSVQSAFVATGGAHCCALFDSAGNLEDWSEDVGRHNALDKLIGKVILKKIMPLSDHLILLSGRASFELIHKAYMVGCPIVIALGAPSSLAIETAEACNMTLVGFLKNDKANIYSAEERILQTA